MIEIKDLTKTYGSATILNAISLNISNGETYCLLGKNGAGKTTLINIIVDLIKPTNGTVRFFDKQTAKLTRSEKKKIGVVGENLGLIEELNAFEFLTLVGKIYQLPTLDLQKRIHDLFQFFFENEKDIKKNISKYSTGMKKKIAFCAAVIHLPEVLILDEPFSGLDPLVANQLVMFLNKYKSPERTILISSHDLTYVEKISTHIGVLNNAELAFNSTIEDFTENGESKLDTSLLKILKPNLSELDKIDWI